LRRENIDYTRMSQSIEQFWNSQEGMTQMKISMIQIICFLIACFTSSEAILAGTINVSSVDALEKAIADAAPGDQIIAADGVYTTTGSINITKTGTQEKPIEIAAQTVGGAEIKGAGGFSIVSPAAYVVIRGFKFTHAPGRGGVSIGVGANHCRVTRNVFELTLTGKSPYLTVSGNDHEIDHNTFQNKSTEGQMISVQGPGGSEMAQRTWIHHNYFYNFKPTSNNCAAIQIGLSGRSMSSAFSVVEYNLFVKTAGENEGCVCNKCCDNIYRFNTFGEGGTELSLRHGNRCRVYANFFIGSNGIRFYGKEHQIYSNYFENCRPAISIGNGDGLIPPDALTRHDRPVNTLVAFNTLVNNRVNVFMQNRRSGLGANDLVFADNVIQGGGKAVTIGGPLANPVWEGNILWDNNGGAGDIPETGYTTLDPQLKQVGNDKYHLSSGSPAIGKAAGSHEDVVLDIDGQARGAKKDAGADQVSDAPVINHILTASDVGPNAPEGIRPMLAVPKEYVTDGK
jgi:poly(beta-D-mannuronate) lyase